MTRFSGSKVTFGSLLLGLALVSGPPPASSAGTTPTVLPRLGGTSTFATGVNAAGTIVGAAERADGSWHAVVWSDGTIRDLGTLGGDNSQAEDIDDSGRIVGSAQAADGSNHAVLWVGRQIYDLGLRSDFQASASASANGYIAGTWYATDNPWAGRRASLVSGAPGAFTRTRIPAPPGASADAVNSSGVVVGTDRWVDYRDPAFENRRAYVWQPGGAVTELGTLGGPGSIGTDLNDAGHVVGTSSTASGVPRAFYWDGARMRALRSPATETPTAQAINGSDVVVGTFGTSGHAVVWDSPTARPRRLPEPAGSSGSAAVDVNASGVVVGYVEFAAGGFSDRATVWR